MGDAMLTTFASDLPEAERSFVAYAAHELRGEISVQLTLAQATLADPHADAAALRQMGEGIVAACWRQERLLEALLTLSRSEYGRLRREPVDLAATAAEVLRAHDHHGLITTTALEPARTTGDPRLIERLVANLVANAISHNIPGGRLDVATRTAAGRATFTIANTGSVIPADELTRLFEPFQRLSDHPGPSDDGFGLGLAIVRAIAGAHDATVTAHARPGGGLRIDIDFPTDTPPRLEVVHGGPAAATAVGH
jgi:signal transduction histidine kinase